VVPPTTSHQPALRRLFAFVGIPLVLVGVFATVAMATSSTSNSDLGRVRQATARFHDLRKADAAGYKEFFDVDGIACIDMPGMGAMGIHYVNGNNASDAIIDPQAPEAVLYEPDANGQQHMVAVEYLVVKSAWDATHTSPPSLFGKTFDFTPSPNRFGLPPFYSLHAWIGKPNPAGTFAMFNPSVTCDPSGHGVSGMNGMNGMNSMAGMDGAYGSP